MDIKLLIFNLSQIPLLTNLICDSDSAVSWFVSAPIIPLTPRPAGHSLADMWGMIDDVWNYVYKQILAEDPCQHPII